MTPINPAHQSDDHADWRPDLKAIEAQLAALRPREDGLDRERLMFLAGQASVRRPELTARRWAWPASFAAMTAAAVLLLAIVLRHEPGVSVDLENASSARNGLSAADFESAAVQFDSLVLKAGMPPLKVEQVSIESWKLPRDTRNLRSDSDSSVISARSLKEVL
jgi:hypothetical protein